MGSSNAPWSRWNSGDVELAEKTTELGGEVEILEVPEVERAVCSLVVTLMDTVVCWSFSVVKRFDVLVGMTVFLGINLFMTPPTISIPRVRGVTSRRRISASTAKPQLCKQDGRHL
jgi:hypothetical protein